MKQDCVASKKNIKWSFNREWGLVYAYTVLHNASSWWIIGDDWAYYKQHKSAFWLTSTKKRLIYPMKQKKMSLTKCVDPIGLCCHCSSLINFAIIFGVSLLHLLSFPRGIPFPRTFIHCGAMKFIYAITVFCRSLVCFAYCVSYSVVLLLRVIPFNFISKIITMCRINQQQWLCVFFFSLNESRLYGPCVHKRIINNRNRKKNDKRAGRVNAIERASVSKMVKRKQQQQQP